MAHSATHEVDVDQWSPKTTQHHHWYYTIIGLHRKHTQPAKHAAKTSKEESLTETETEIFANRSWAAPPFQASRTIVLEGTVV